MMRKTDRKIRDIISTIIAYAVISAPIIILIVVMAFSYYEKVKNNIMKKQVIKKYMKGRTL